MSNTYKSILLLGPLSLIFPTTQRIFPLELKLAGPQSVQELHIYTLIFDYYPSFSVLILSFPEIMSEQLISFFWAPYITNLLHLALYLNHHCVFYYVAAKFPLCLFVLGGGVRWSTVEPTLPRPPRRLISALPWPLLGKRQESCKSEKELTEI